VLSPAVPHRQSQESTLAPTGSAFFAVPDLTTTGAGGERGPIVVWVRGGTRHLS
jgi:hypothetical protein